MDGVVDELLKSAAGRLRGAQRRTFLADVCLQLCDGNSRKAEFRFGRGRQPVEKELEERQADPAEVAARKAKNWGKNKPSEEDAAKSRTRNWPSTLA